MVKAARIVFFGTEAWGVPSLEQLIADGFDIAGVVTRPDAPVGRKRRLEPTPLKVAAAAHGLMVLEPAEVKELIPRLTELQPVLGVLIAYGKIIPQSVLDLFPLGIINLHPSALPSYRGPSPVETAILNGDEVGHISLIKLDASMDAGDIIASHHIKLKQAATLAAPEAYRLIGQAAAPLLATSIRQALNGTARYRRQAESQATFSRIITKADGKLDLSRSAIELERQIRAYLGWPGSHTRLGGSDITITAAHVGDTEPFAGMDRVASAPGAAMRTPDSQLAITTGHGELIIDRLIPAGKREMTGREFLAGHSLG